MKNDEVISQRFVLVGNINTRSNQSNICFLVHSQQCQIAPLYTTLLSILPMFIFSLLLLDYHHPPLLLLFFFFFFLSLSSFFSQQQHQQSHHILINHETTAKPQPFHCVQQLTLAHRKYGRAWTYTKYELRSRGIYIAENMQSVEWCHNCFHISSSMFDNNNCHPYRYARQHRVLWSYFDVDRWAINWYKVRHILHGNYVSTRLDIYHIQLLLLCIDAHLSTKAYRNAINSGLVLQFSVLHWIRQFCVKVFRAAVRMRSKRHYVTVL